ncbi:[protein-PII] uridylyltransferase [Alcanivorax sp. 1008]|uniref:[protein-PII] uridylyltransferase n=1 Tax=Alcanivorax sp. 1008 TaxID=2816853 RepID=UPI001DB76C5B|nr:[protein-PII] uridylyltransferase [Alcanivorax sp. 1008]
MTLAPLHTEDQLAELLRATSHPGKAARETLLNGQQRLDDAFADTPIRELVAARAALVDGVLTAAWRFFSLDGDRNSALVAVGGYGRGELHPHSDVDLMILSAAKPCSETCDNLEKFIAFLWDIGLEIGHSVRTLDECVALARDDITIATNIMEARTLFGDDSLRATLAERTGPQQMWPSDQFFEAKRQEQEARHAKFNHTEYSLEPDLKNAPGGLRDLQTIAWVAKRHFGAESLDDLVEVGFLTIEEHSILNKCQDYLWRLRWLLHQINGRNENRLLFDYQRQVAGRLGHKDNTANLAVEQSMKNYYRVALAISVMNELLLQLFDEVILRVGKSDPIQQLNRRFQVRNGYLEVTDENIFQRYPSALIEAFVLLGQNPEIKGVSAPTARLMIQNRKLIDDTFRQDSRNTSLFMELLRSPHALFTQLRRMKRYGILGQYLPEFGRIIGMMQYDLFHIYTVDFHTLTVIKHMRRMRYDSAREQLPLAHEVFYRLPKPELLYIAGLYHDIAKGRGGDHSTLGADDAIAFCQRHGLTNWDAKLVAWMVQNHLLMSVTAQRKDISDPDVVHEFAGKVGDLVHLDYLYTLTVADINATNPNLWNSWRASLLRQLYRETRRTLRRGLNNPVDKQDWIDETRDTALKLLEQRQIDRSAIEQLWSGIGDEYFLRENAADIAWHTEAILNRPDPKAPLVLTRESSGVQFEGGTQLFIYTPDTENLFATTVSAIDQLGLTIVDARIITSADGFTLDTYVVLDEQGTPIGDDWPRLEAIRTNLTEALSDPACFPDILQRRMPRRHRHFNVPTQVVISNDIINDRTTVDIQTLDRPGLLARIGRIFAEFNLLVQNARIATLGERAEDVFFVTGRDGLPVSDPELCQRLQKYIKEELDDLKETGAA